MEMVLTFAIGLIVLFLVAAGEFCRPRRHREFPAFRRRLRNISIWVANLLLRTLFFDQPERLRPVFEMLLGTHFPSWPIGNPWLGLVAGFILLDLMRYGVH